MTSHVIEFDEECKACKGTGLYVGLAERDGSAVVCYKCQGTGCYHFRYEYTDFAERKWRDGVKRVVRANPGIVVGTGNGHALADFGGVSYPDWLANAPFPRGSEMRQFTCPAWWYQTVDYDKKPDWHECNMNVGVRFSACQQFHQKSLCWQRWDREAEASQKGGAASVSGNRSE